MAMGRLCEPSTCAELLLLQVFLPGRPVELLPALPHFLGISVGNVDVNEIDPSLVSGGREGEDQVRQARGSEAKLCELGLQPGEDVDWTDQRRAGLDARHERADALHAQEIEIGVDVRKARLTEEVDESRVERVDLGR